MENLKEIYSGDAELCEIKILEAKDQISSNANNHSLSLDKIFTFYIICDISKLFIFFSR